MPLRSSGPSGGAQDRSHPRTSNECRNGRFPEDSTGATAHKAERYETFLRGLADVPRRVTHYAVKYPDGWAAEVLFLVPTDGRRQSTEGALAAAVRESAGLGFRVSTLNDALVHLHGLLPSPTPPAD